MRKYAYQKAAISRNIISFFVVLVYVFLMRTKCCVLPFSEATPSQYQCQGGNYINCSKSVRQICSICFWVLKLNHLTAVLLIQQEVICKHHTMTFN